MSEFRGTRGKWVICHFNEFEHYISNGTHRICEVKHYPNKISEYLEEPTKIEGKANALLISKAPEMLEMLNKCKEAILELMDHQDGWEDDYEELEHLIKEATEIK